MSPQEPNDALIRSYEDALPIALLRTRETVMARFRPHLTKHGLTEQQWRVIRAVQQRDDIDATALSERCCILMPSMSRMLKSLESDGLLTRKAVKGDRRRQQISLTKKGHELFRKMAPESENIYAKIEQSFGKDEIALLTHTLRSLRNSLEP